MTMLGLETEYDDFVALLSSVNAEFTIGGGTIQTRKNDRVKTKDIIFMGESAPGHSIPCLRFDAETGKFLGGWCDDGHY